MSVGSVTLEGAAPFDSRPSHWKPRLLPSLSSLSRGPEDPAAVGGGAPSPSEDLQSRAHVTPLQALRVACRTPGNGMEGPWAEAPCSWQELGFV